MRTREQLKKEFKEHFKRDPEFFFRAPGRVNLMGEHSDYNGGFVFPCAINVYTSIALAISQDDQFHAISKNFSTSMSSWPSSAEQSHDPKSSWADYLRGLTLEFVKAGHRLKPMTMFITSDVPIGCGLSSSAALQMSFATAMNEINNLGLSPLQLAQLAKASENNFVGSQCGIMDQLVSGTAREGHVSLIDCESMTWEYVPMDPRWQLLVINSGIPRTLTGSAFNTRVEECAKARNLLSGRLRDVRLNELEECRPLLGEKPFKRARHVLTDNYRVPMLAKAIKDYDLESVSELMTASHHSMDQDFEMTIPEINDIFYLVKKELKEEGGIRLTGGGWGGALVALTTKDKVKKIRDLILEHYNLEKKQKAEFFVFKTAAGACSF